MRVVLVSHALVQPRHRGTVAALARLGVEPILAVPERWPDSDGQLLRTTHATEGGLRVVPIPVRGRLGDPFEVRWHAGALRRLLSDTAPAVVHVEEPPGSPPGAMALRLAARLKLPAVVLAREAVHAPSDWGVRRRRKASLRRASLIAAASRPAADLAAELAPGHRVVVLPRHGVTAPLAPERRPHDGFVIGFSGRLAADRGLDLLFRAGVRLRGAWRIEVVGSGPEQEQLEDMAARLGMAARVTWHGALAGDRRAEVLAGVDCLVMPPHASFAWREPVGAAVLEAMAHEVAVVGTATGLIPELLGDAGIVVPEEDEVALATALQQLLDTPDFRAALAAAGRRRVLAEYSDEAVARRTLALWREVAGGPGSGAG